MAKFATQALERFETDSYTGDYFEPDIMLPSQYNNSKADGLDGGERKLMAALLSDGVQAYLEQAISYVKGASSTYIFSFDNVCGGLGICPEYLRVGLARFILKARNKKKGANVQEFPIWKRIRRPRKR
jgi:hypothetical protein